MVEDSDGYCSDGDDAVASGTMMIAEFFLEGEQRKESMQTRSCVSVSFMDNDNMKTMMDYWALQQQHQDTTQGQLYIPFDCSATQTGGSSSVFK